MRTASNILSARPTAVSMSAVALCAFTLSLGLALPSMAAPTSVPSKEPVALRSAAPRTGYAIVVQDHTALRSGPRDSTPIQAVLWQGDALEVRGQRLDYLQVYDHRRERAGYVRATQVRTLQLSPDEAPELLSVLRFVKDTPGSEALGLAYAAAYLKVAPAGTHTAEVWDALGLMAERLADRATSRHNNAASTPTAADTRLAGQLEGLPAYGIKITSVERDGSMQLCYDGDAYARVLGQNASPQQRTRAVLGLTRQDCQDAATTPTAQHMQDLARVRLLDQSLSVNDWAQLPDTLKNRLQMRRAGLLATLAHQHSRMLLTNNATIGTSISAASLTDHALAMQQSSHNAISALAAVNKAELTDDDLVDYHQAALRVGASLWASVPAAVATSPTGKASTRVNIVTRAGNQPGETCIALVDAQHDAKHPLHERCTYGTVWPASASVNASGTALALAVQPLAAWRELWLYRKTVDGWVLDVLPPGIGKPELGYVEHAGWVSGANGNSLLLAREALVDGRIKRNFEVVRLSDLGLDKQASTHNLLSGFAKGQSAAWKAMTVSLR